MRSDQGFSLLPIRAIVSHRRLSPTRPAIAKTVLHDLADHGCTNLRLPSSGGLYAWEFDQAGKELKVSLGGQFVLNDVDLIVQAP